MESESESRPLLHPFERETWRSSIRKRCLRIPSEVTITGIILGLFLVVVTLLIVLENLETTNKNELTLDNNLLASPFKYNKKALDLSWQEKKDSIKSQKKSKYQKWNKVDKSWKISDSPGMSNKAETTDFVKNSEGQLEINDLPVGSDEYGKEIDDNWESLLEQAWSVANSMKDQKDDETEAMYLLQSSKIKWKKLDDGWKTLSKQGWKDKDIKGALIKAIQEKKAELEKQAGNLQSPINFDDFWDKINDSWKKNMHKGDKEREKQEIVNDEWKNKMQLLQSPKAADYKWKKVDNGWKKISDQGWKNKELKESLFKAIKDEKDALNKQEGILQSPKNLDDIWDEIHENWKDNVDKGDKEREKQETINDDWKNKFHVLESPKALDKKWKKVNDGWKKLLNQGWEEKEIREALFKAIQEKKSTLDNQAGILQSPMNLDDMWDEIDSWNKDMYEKGLKEKGKQETINDDWKSKIQILQSSKASDKKWKKDDDGWKKLLDQDWKKKDIEEALINAWKEKQSLLKPQINVQNLWGKTLDVLKNLIQKDSEEDNSRESADVDWSNRMKILKSAKTSNKMKDDKGWKLLSKQGWKDSEIKEALIDALKEITGILQSKKAFENFLDDVIQALKYLQKKESNFHKKKNTDVTSGTSSTFLQSSVAPDKMDMIKLDNGWKQLLDQGVGLPTRCPISKIQRQALLSSEMLTPPVDCALIAEEVRRKFGKCIDISFLPKVCKPSWRTKCFSSYKYRKIDGTCNNKIHPTWGKSGTPFVRMLAPDYDDGVSALRSSKNGSTLPNARFLSSKLYSKRMKPNSDLSILFLYFGLIVDHDMIQTAVNSDAIPCCDEEFQKNPQNRPRECLQIDVPRNDPFYGPRNVTCLNLVRSVPVNGECAGRREQLNLATSYLDGSAIYGSDMKQVKHLRAFSKGQLRTQHINNTPFMPADAGASESCGRTEPLKCFEAGDPRVNMVLELTAMHTLWHREHNRIATELHKINSQWTDEILFQEARRILIGELQQITYNEFLPLLLDEKAMKQYELSMDTGKIYSGYDDTVDPTVFNVIGAAALRVGHSLVPDTQLLSSQSNSTLGNVVLHETFFNAGILYHNGLDLLLRGAATQRAQTVDSYITSEVREHLFQPAHKDYGHDLAAIGIQRGRDHGLPSYTKWRSVCGLTEVNSWDDLYKIMDKERADMFKELYMSVEDIDLIPGALAEHHAEGSLLGPMHVCLIGRQFKKTRKGDRFWFETQNEIGSFSRDQLGEIYKSSMARIICDNSDNIKKIQKHPFNVPSDHNPVLDCGAIPKVDLSKWNIKI